MTISAIWTAIAQPYCRQHTHRVSYKSVKRAPSNSIRSAIHRLAEFFRVKVREGGLR